MTWRRQGALFFCAILIGGCSRPVILPKNEPEVAQKVFTVDVQAISEPILPAEEEVVPSDPVMPASPPAPLTNPYWSAQFALPPVFIPVIKERRRPKNHDRDWLLNWNQISIDASGLDHTPVQPGENRIFGEQLGPTRSSRALAIVHIALFEVINAIKGGYKSYLDLRPVEGDISLRAALAYAGHDTLVALFPSQRPFLDEELALELDQVDDSQAKTRGRKLGQEAAERILARRQFDHSDRSEPRMGTNYFPPVGMGDWGVDPISHLSIALGAYWGQVTPFVLKRPDQFRAPPPPAMTSQAYAKAFKETKELGGDGITTATERTQEETEIGIFWAYDGTPSLCAPPRLYNQIATHIADQEGTDLIGTARLLALINVGMADAAIASWETKFFYNFWRPVVAIRDADQDGNPHTEQDASFSPLGAPASNLNGPNFTPPFPTYTSGHATFGGTIFEILRRFYGRDDIAFTFVSDEFNGKTRDNKGNIRPKLARSFQSFSEAEEENGQSRIYLGIHWAFDKVEGIAQGRKVGDWVWKGIFRPD